MTICVTDFGSTPAPRRLPGSLPSVGYMVLPAPASIMITLPPRRMRKLFTGIWNVPLSEPPPSRSTCAASISTTLSSDVGKVPSLRPCTSTSPIRILGNVMSEPFPRQRDHASRRHDDGDGKYGKRRDEAAVGISQDVTDHQRRQRPGHLRDQGPHALRLAHILSADDAVHQHFGAGDADLLRAQRADHQDNAPGWVPREGAPPQ